MKKLMERIEDTFAAAAFAEAGEFETAKEIMESQPIIESKIQTLKEEVETTIDDLISMAVTFAESGEREKAIELLNEAESKFGKVKEDIHKEFLSPAANR